MGKGNDKSGMVTIVHTLSSPINSVSSTVSRLRDIICTRRPCPTNSQTGLSVSYAPLTTLPRGALQNIQLR